MGVSYNLLAEILRVSIRNISKRSENNGQKLGTPVSCTVLYAGVAVMHAEALGTQA